MIKAPSRRREQILLRLEDSDREVAAAWLVLFFVIAAGMSVLGAHQYGAGDCLTLPGSHYRPLAVNEEWEDPACSGALCERQLAVHERDDEDDRAAEDGGASTAAYSQDRSMRLDPIGNAGKQQDEPLCS